MLDALFTTVKPDTTPVQLVQARALALFSGVLSGDLSTLKWIGEKQSASDEVMGVSVLREADEELLVFSLLALYQLLNLEPELAFSVFRRALYQGDLNEELASKGGRIHVYESVGSLDENIYALAKL